MDGPHNPEKENPAHKMGEINESDNMTHDSDKYEKLENNFRKKTKMGFVRINTLVPQIRILQYGSFGN